MNPRIRTWLAAALLLSGAAHASGPDIVNIVNFIRGVEPRVQVDLVEPVAKQIELARIAKRFFDTRGVTSVREAHRL